MQAESIRSIISGIRRFDLTAFETDFISFAEQNLSQGGPIHEAIELILEEIYWQKTRFIRNSIASMLREERNPFHPANSESKFRLSIGRF